MQLSAASPMPMQRAPSSRLASGMLETFSSLNSDEQGEMNLDPELAEDEEFATEEHAHRFSHTLDTLTSSICISYTLLEEDKDTAGVGILHLSVHDPVLPVFCHSV